MTNQQLLDYIKQQLQLSTSREQIKATLLSTGWQAQDVDAAFSSMSDLVAPPQPQIVPSTVQTISSLPGATEILEEAWSIYKERLFTFLGIVLIPTLITSVLGAILILIGLSTSSIPSPKIAGIGVGVAIALAILVLVIIFISTVWGQLALIYAIKDRQENIGLVEAYRRGRSKILSYWWVLLLMGFITIGGFILLIIPGIIFAVWFSLAIFIVVSEDLKGMAALLKSKGYVRGRWGSVFWRFLLIGIFYVAISLFITFIFWLLNIPYSSEINKFIMGLFLTPLMVTYMFLLYSNLKTMRGDVAFTPTEEKKTAFILVGILGFLIVPIGLFSSIFLVSLKVAREKGRDYLREKQVKSIQLGLELYRGDNNNYPSSLGELSPKYLPNTPVDPSTGQVYKYQLEAGSLDYKVCADMEMTKTETCVTSKTLPPLPKI